MAENVFLEHIDESARALDKLIEHRAPKVGIILGSGLGSVADALQDAIVVPFSLVPHMGVSTAEGHVGCFVVGRLCNTEVICMRGRLHGYEGYASMEVAWPIWIMHALGVEVLIATNAAGAINPAFNVGDFCVISDHINFTGRNPLQGREQDALATRFPSMYEAYDSALRDAALKAASSLHIPAHEGVYIGVLGPSLETPAEIAAFGRWGADVVAMSLVEEVIAARHVGMRVLGISLCSNMACGVGEDFSGENVIEVASSRADDLLKLICAVLACL